MTSGSTSLARPRTAAAAPGIDRARPQVAALACVLALAFPAGPARAGEPAPRADWPSRPFRLVVPFVPGGSVDVFARLVGARLADAMAQPVIIDNRGGAGSILGMEIVARAPADGYTLLVHSAAFTTAAALHQKLAFDPERDLLPVALLGVGSNILAVHADSPVKSLQDLIALARSQPGRLHYGSGGPGSSSHLTTELLLRAGRFEMTHVPYKGLGPAVTALLGNQVQVLLVGMPNVMPHIRAGRLRALAVSTEKRSPFAPDVPTIAEAGVPGYASANWWGLWAPGRTPSTLVRRLNAEIGRILQSSELRERLASEGAEPLAATPEVFAARVRAEIAAWRTLAREGGFRLD